jgi:TPR repeat protein
MKHLYTLLAVANISYGLGPSTPTPFASHAQPIISNNTTNITPCNEMDITETFEWFRYSDRLGNIDSSCRLGFYYLDLSEDLSDHNTQGSQNAYNTAYQYFNKAASKGQTQAKYEMAFYHFKNHNSLEEHEIEEQIEILENAAENNYKNAKLILAQYYIHYTENPTFHAQATRYLHEFIQTDPFVADYAEAYYQLGLCYQNNMGVQQTNNDTNAQIAFKCFKEATQNDHIKSLTELGYCYLNGNGTEKNLRLSASYFNDAAEKNCPEAQLEFALINLGGRGFAINTESAFYYFSLASNQGLTKAHYFVALCHLSGIGAPENHKLAVDFLLKAAPAGHYGARYLLSCCYKYGIGREKNLEQASACENEIPEDMKQQTINQVKHNVGNDKFLSLFPPVDFDNSNSKPTKYNQ